MISCPCTRTDRIVRWSEPFSLLKASVSAADSSARVFSRPAFSAFHFACISARPADRALFKADRAEAEHEICEKIVNAECWAGHCEAMTDAVYDAMMAELASEED